jgi:hypothetical protein
VAAMAVMLLLDRSAGRRLGASLILPLVAGTTIAVAYLITFLPPYFAIPLRFVETLWVWQQVLLVLLLGAGGLIWVFANRLVPGGRVRALVPMAIVAVVWLAASYAFFIRVSAGRLAQHDADALRTFAGFYLSPYALLAALAGFAILARRPGWTSMPFLVAMTGFSLFFFYKIRIIPEHFWAARRLVALILPGSLLLVGAAAFAPLLPAVSRAGRALRAVRYVAGSVLVLALGYHYVSAAAPIRRHVEYAGLIPRLEQLAATFGDDDLVLVEARAASDVHVLGLPLAYVYARHVLVLWEAAPDKQVFREFLAWASTRHRRVFFVGGGGTELLSRSMAVSAIRGERFQIPEYQSVWNTYPRAVTFKEFDFGIYEFLPGSAAGGAFDLDVGAADDLYVRRFHAKEAHPGGFTFRWTRDVSYVSLVGMVPDCGAVSITMGSGGRPPDAGPADVNVLLGGRLLGAVRVTGEMQSYAFAIPPDVAATLAQSDDAAQLRLEARAWSPRQLAGAGDDRDLGVMVDRITTCGESAGVPQPAPGDVSSSR